MVKDCQACRGTGAGVLIEMMIEDLGARVASVWEGLRPATRKLIVGALQGDSGSGSSGAAARSGYDARADWELSRLLSALDERVKESGDDLNEKQAQELKKMAATCASVLLTQTQSAEVFAQLLDRIVSVHDYARIDVLADALTSRFAPAEICELARSQNIIARALANEALAQSPLSALINLLDDPLDSEIAKDAIARQAFEYGSAEARQFLTVLEQEELDNEGI